MGVFGGSGCAEKGGGQWADPGTNFGARFGVMGLGIWFALMTMQL